MYIKCVNKNKKHVCTHIFHKLFIFLMLLFIILVFVVLSLGIPLCNVFVNSGKKGKKTNTTIIGKNTLKHIFHKMYEHFLF